MLPAGQKEGRAWVPRYSDSVGDRDTHPCTTATFFPASRPAMASLPRPVFLRVGLLAASQFCQPLGNLEPVPPQCTPLTQPSTPVLPSPRPSCAPVPPPCQAYLLGTPAASPCLRAVPALPTAPPPLKLNPCSRPAGHTPSLGGGGGSGWAFTLGQSVSRSTNSVNKY